MANFAGSDGLYGIFWNSADGNIYTRGNDGVVVNQGKNLKTSVYTKDDGSRGWGFDTPTLSTDKYRWVGTPEAYRGISNPSQNEADNSQLDLGGAIGSYYGGTGGYYSGGSTGAVAKPARDPAAEAMYQSGIDQTNNLLGQIGSRRDTALQGLLGSYNTSNQRAQNAYKDYESDYTTNVDRMTRQNAQKKSQIDSTVRNNITALQRLLASRGAGSSSAAQFAVPSAVAQKGTSDRYDAQQTFNDNMDHKIHISTSDGKL